MAKINYYLTQRKNPITKQYKYYAQTRVYSNIGTREIVKYASETSQIDPGVLESVMMAWQQVMRMYFTNGHNVTCHPLGSFCATIRSKSAATEEDFKPSNIKGLYVTFRPARQLRIAKNKKNVSFANIQ